MVFSLKPESFYESPSKRGMEAVVLGKPVSSIVELFPRQLILANGSQNRLNDSRALQNERLELILMAEMIGCYIQSCG